MFSRSKRPRHLVATLVVYAAIHTPVVGAGPGIAEYVNHYGTANAAEHPLIASAHAIFERVVRVADLDGKRQPVLVTLDSDTRPWAVALPSGHIALSRGAVEFCYEGVSREAGDARLAFVLGHEIAHLSSDDFWHRDIGLALSGSEAGAQLGEMNARLRDEKWFATLRDSELRADDRGFLYASLAGYQTEHLVHSGTVDDNFFHAWVKQTQSGKDPAHQRPESRFGLLATRLAYIQRMAALFEFGVRLAQQDRLNEALIMFEEFRKVFPSREVLNNIGFVHLQLARRLMSRERRSFYWLPMMLEGQRSMRPATRGLAGEDHDAILAALDKAVYSLEQAVSDDTLHLPSRVNLSIAYLYRGDMFKARAMIEEARSLRPDDAEIEALRAIILVEQENEIDMWPISVEILRDYLTRSGAAMIRYNLARMLEERGRSGQALAHWRILHTLGSGLPKVYRDRVCSRVAKPCEDGKDGDASPAPSPGDEVPLGKNLDSAAGRAFLNGWQQIFDEDLESIRVSVFRDTRGRELLALDRFIEMIVLRQSTLTTESLELCCGPRTSTRVLSTGDEIWNFAGSVSALVKYGSVDEIWRTP